MVSHIIQPINSFSFTQNAQQIILQMPQIYECPQTDLIVIYYKLKYSKILIYQFHTMTKKINSKSQPKPLRRTSTILKVLAEGEQFLAQTKKRRIVRTSTIAQTIKEGKAILAQKPKKSVRNDESKSKSAQSNADKNKKKKKITKANTSKKVTASKDKASTSKTDKKDTTTKKSTIKPAIAPSASSPPSLPGNIKKTIFKTKSKDHLPIPAFGFIDVCFCIDATGSMGSELAQAQSTILSIINNIENKVRTQGLTLRFAVVSYRDHPPQDLTYVTQALDFTDGHEASEYVQKLQAWGGGDAPQAVHDGLMHCCKNLNWVELPGTPVLRYIFHIADAHPHGKEFGNGHEANEGCLCGMIINQVYHEINVRQIHFRLIKARSNPLLSSMEEKFKKNIVDFSSANLSNAREMDVKVSDMIIHEVVPM